MASKHPVARTSRAKAATKLTQRTSENLNCLEDSQVSRDVVEGSEDLEEDYGSLEVCVISKTIRCCQDLEIEMEVAQRTGQE